MLLLYLLPLWRLDLHCPPQRVGEASVAFETIGVLGLIKSKLKGS